MRRLWCGLGVFVLLVGCGGPQGEAENAPSAPEGDFASSEEGDAADEGEPGGSPSGDANREASADDVNAILQLTIDDPELDPYLKLGSPGRFPLKVSGSALTSETKLVKATEPVQVVDGPESDKDPVLVITDVEIDGDTATVRYRYPIEGVRGTARLTKTPHGWQLKSSRVVEH